MTNPKLRFTIGNHLIQKDWKQVQLKDCVSFSKGGSLSKSDIDPKGSQLCLLYGELYTTYGEITRYVLSKTNVVENLVTSKKDDVLLPMSGETAEDIAKATCVQQDGVAYGGDLLVLRSNRLCGVFLSYSLNSANRKKISRIAQGKTVVHINSARVSEITINVPELYEQRRIAAFFTTLDEKITLAERKLAALQTLKSGLMQKIFDGEIRFKREDGSTFPEWEKTRLDQLVQFQNGINTSRDNFGSGTKLISVLEVLSAKPITYETIRSSVVVDNVTATKFAVTYGDVLFQRSSETAEDAGMANVYLDQERSAVFGGFVIRGKKISEYNPIFLMEVLRSASVRRQMMKLAQGAQHVNIGQESLSQIVIELPSSEEQNKIAGIAATLSQKIDLVEQKLAAVKQQKQAFLQQMFI